MSTRLVVIGAGGFGRETLDVVEAINTAASSPVFELLGVVDAAPSELNRGRLADRGIPVLGTLEQWIASGDDAQVAVAIGTPRVRQRIARTVEEAGLTAATLVHPDAQIGSMAAIAPGAIICGGVQFSTNVSIGSHVHLNPNSTIGHDTVIGDFVSVNPGAVISGDVTIGRCTLVGAGAVVLQGLALGADVVVGASACVVRDVAPSTTVKGVPAR
jgi:sugar O-acyltransferase (sialic acid O-acetyltransferase NeuD family)